MYRGLHPKSDVDRLYVKRKEEGRGLISVISVERCTREEENSIGFFVANTEKKNLLEGYQHLRQLI